MPSLEWIDTNKASIATRKLGQTLGLNPEGEVTLGWGADTDNAVELLCSLYRFSERLPSNIKYQFTRRAVIEAKKSNSLTLADIAQRIDGKQGEYLRKPLQRYDLLTNLSLRASSAIPGARIEGAAISFSRHPPKKFKPQDYPSQRRTHYGRPPSDYAAAVVRIESRDPSSAGAQAIQTLDLLRGIWNFYVNYRRWRVSFGGGNAPFNSILLGPIHLLFDAGGKPTDNVWWEPEYIEPRPTIDLSQRWGSLKKFEARVRHGLAVSPHRRLLRTSLLRYCRALDERDHSTSFMKMWSLLEDLTATGNADHMTTVRRATFLSPDPEFHRLALDHLRRWRNRIVHEGESADEAERMINEVKSYAEGLFLILLQHGHRFMTLAEFGNFLDSPVALSDLRRRASHLQLALKFRG